MEQGRVISASLGQSRKFRRLVVRDALIGEFAQCLFVLVVACSDRYGLCKADPESLKLEVFQASLRSEKEFEAALRLMEEVELIKRYEAKGEEYLEVQNFDRFQPGLRRRGNPRRGKPEYPPPPWFLHTFPKPSSDMPGSSKNLPHTPSLSAEHPNGKVSREREGGTGGKPTRQMSEDEYLDHLQALPAYAHLKVREVNAKMLAWCDAKDKKPSRARLVGWLNREKPPEPATRVASKVGASSNGSPPKDWQIFFAGELNGFLKELQPKDVEYRAMLEAGLEAIARNDYAAFRIEREKIQQAGFQLQ